MLELVDLQLYKKVQKKENQWLVWNASTSLLSPNRGYPAWKLAHMLFI